MWDEQAHQDYARSRSRSFSGQAPATHDHMHAPSPAFPTPQNLYQPGQPGLSPAPVSPGGFVIPSHGYEPQVPPMDWETRGRTIDRGFDIPRAHVQGHHADGRLHRRHRRHSQAHEQVHVHSAPQGQHHHGHKHHSRERRSSSQNRIPNITVHANGQTYMVPPRADYQHYSATPVPPVAGATMIPPPGVRPSHSANHLHYANAAAARMYIPAIMNPQPQMQMPVARLPPREVQYYGPRISNKQHYFQYSQCSKRKKALCIGINYVGQANQLNGCINDAKRMQRFLIRRYGFKPGDIVLLTDEGKSQRERPTKRNIIDAMKWLVRDAQPDDSLVFHFSGHGGQTKDLDGDELDGFDEVIYPLDWKRAGHIVDDDMHEIMVKRLHQGCRLTAIFDCCHSGSALDLPYMYGTNGKLKREPNLDRAAGNDTFGDRPFLSDSEGIDGLTRDFEGMMSRGPVARIKRRKYARIIKTSPADVISWSGCKDSQTSADTYQNNEATGAMSYAFMSSLKAKPDQTYQELLVNIRKILKNKFSQKPQLSSSHPIDTSLKFVL